MLLKEKDRIRLINFFSNVKQPIEVLAYGSRVNGSAHEGSDLDLAIRMLNGQLLPPGVLSSLREAIRDSNIPILVDLYDYAALPRSFQQNINQQHEVLYSSPGTTIRQS